MLRPFGPDLFYADGPTVSFMGFPYPTRMALARLSSGKIWVWSPIALTSQLSAEVDALGPVESIVSPNKLHHLFLAQWKERWPQASLYAPPRLARRRPRLRFDAELGDGPAAAWQADIDQAIFRGSLLMEEVVFFHRPSRTVIVGDLIQRFPEAELPGWKGLLLRIGGIGGAQGSTPRDWRLTFISRRAARRARRAVLAWQPERLLIAHGECATSGAGAIVAAALSWI